MIILTHHYEGFVGDRCPLGQQAWLVSQVDTSRGDHRVAELADSSLPLSNIQFHSLLSTPSMIVAIIYMLHILIVILFISISRRLQLASFVDLKNRWLAN